MNKHSYTSNTQQVSNAEAAVAIVVMLTVAGGYMLLVKSYTPNWDPYSGATLLLTAPGWFLVFWALMLSIFRIK